MISKIIEQLGGTKAAAKTLGVTQRTVQYWKAGVTVNPKHAATIEKHSQKSARNFCPGWRFKRSSRGVIESWVRIGGES